MKISSGLMKFILDKTTDAEEVTKEILRYTKICEERWKIEREKQEALNNYKQKVQFMDDKYREICVSCDHPVTTFVGDPAGGTDSYHECDVCGQNISRRKSF